MSTAWQEQLADGLRARLSAPDRPAAAPDRPAAAPDRPAAAPDRPAGSRIVAVDGWSGSGKTSLAAGLAPALAAPCVHLDDLVPGWGGLEASVELLARLVIGPLTAGRPARWRRWDWTRAAWGEAVTLAPVPVVVVEGCGAGARALRPSLAALVWLDVPAPERDRRLRDRDDWHLYEPWAQRWAEQERRLRAGDDPSTRADAVVEDGPAAVRIRWRDLTVS